MENDTHAFVIRIWHETVDSEGKTIAWRGSIDYVGKNKRLYFYDIDGISNFIQEQLEIKKRGSPGWWQVFIGKFKNGIIEFRNRHSS